MGRIALLGCGFVADLYLRSLRAMSGIEVAAVYDRDAARLDRFCAHWGLPKAGSLTGFLETLPEGALVLVFAGAMVAVGVAQIAARRSKGGYEAL